MRKDYYEILRVFPSSSMEEIRKSYRKLAFRYHPDTNPDDELAAGHFREISEAYETLSNVGKRLDYDCTYGFRSKQFNINLAPHMLLQEASRLRRYVSSLNHYSMDQEALEYHLHRLLSDRNLEVLRNFDHATLNRQILRELIDAARFLQYNKLAGTITRMKLLANEDPSSLQLVDQYWNSRKNRHIWERILSGVVFVITLILCLIIYELGN